MESAIGGDQAQPRALSVLASQLEGRFIGGRTVIAKENLAGLTGKRLQFLGQGQRRLIGIQV